MWDREQQVSRFFVPMTKPEDVINHLGQREAHWAKGRSAYELSYAWLQSGGIPATVRAVLDSCPDYRGVSLVEGFFEKKVDLLTAGTASQTDLLAILSKDGGLRVVAVEGKVDETFDYLVKDWLAKQGKGGRRASRKPQRLQALCATLALASDSVGHLRYQLLHRTASAIYEARRYCTGRAMMLVHSFSPQHAGFADFQAFASAIGAPVTAVGSISEPVSRDGVEIRLGWVADRPME